MIKEYSRSSADQQEPLPHELRPQPVLKFTMEYLICNFMNKPSNNISLEEWYDFIWNRTRSIRKVRKWSHLHIFTLSFYYAHLQGYVEVLLKILVHFR